MLRFFSYFRNWLYDNKWLKVHRIPDTFVISVGNISMGGTGKTPLVIELLTAYQDQQAALLTRGYGGHYDSSELPLIVTKNSLAEKVGDEPLLIKQACPNTLVVVDPDRVRGGHLAAKEGKRLLILDDGMQHRRLHRDFEIVVVDGENPFPAWKMREPASALSRADVVVVMGGTFTPSGPYVRMKKKFVGAVDFLGNPLSIAGKKVGLFCGVGHPGQVQRTAEEAGAEVIQTLFLPDHEKISFEKLRDFAALCENSGASALLCTEKDRVKLPPSLPLSFQVVSLKIRLEVIEGEPLWRKYLQSIREEIG